MGAESFYLNVKLKSKETQDAEKIIKSNYVYNEYLNYYFDNESNELCLQAAMVSFFPMCEILFDLCTKVNKINQIISVGSRKISKPFNFNDSLDFFCWMYSTWKEPLKNFHEEWGEFLINPSDYYKSRQKLGRKYYVKYVLYEDK